MVSPATGKVVLVPFPFSDLSESKLRPAVILADAGRGDWILCQVTSKPYGDPSSIALTDDSFSEGSLKTASFARPGKLFTGSTSLIVNEVGLLKPEVMKQIVDAIFVMLRPKEPTQGSREDEASGETEGNGEDEGTAYQGNATADRRHRLPR